jgi:HAD superfamily hydrolase (TIGR01509 family)
MIFDLDGTLVQTERLKAYSYAKAIQELSPSLVDEDLIIETFKEVVGLSRREVAQGLLQGFNLEAQAQTRMAEFGVTTPWQAFAQIRLMYYEQMLIDPRVIQDNVWPHNMALLAEARRSGCKVGLATMSDCPQVNRILDILDLHTAFDFVASRDDVENGKPDPEIYCLVATELNVPANECLVVEDSPTGVRAALAAGMKVIAVTTPFTKAAFRKNEMLDPRWVVDDPAILPRVVMDLMEENLNA